MSRHARRTGGVHGLATVLLLALSLWATAAAQQERGGYGGRTIGRTGPYTEAQADRGQEAYARHCASCHLVGLDGVIGVAPPLAGPEFLSRWEGASLYRLFHYVRATMPLDAPRSLHDRTYADVLAHVLRENGVESGDTELRPSADVLSRTSLPNASDEHGPRRGTPGSGQGD